MSLGISKARRILVICSAVVLAVGLAMLLVLSDGGGASSETRSETTACPSVGRASAFLSSGPTFGALDQMVATADLVVMGTVTDVRGGEVDAAGTPEEVRDLNTAVGVEEVLKGAASGDPVIVKTQELAYSGPGDAEWRRSGERVLLFLSRSRERDTRGLYIVAGISYDQAAYLRRDDELCATRKDPLSARVASLSVPELRREVEEAEARAARGKVKPLEF